VRNLLVWLTLRRALIIAVVIAVVAFLSITNYNPKMGLVGNAMHGWIFWDDDGINKWPYRWILIWLAIFVGAVALKGRGKAP
jgi:hypothetical protein